MRLTLIFLGGLVSFGALAVDVSKCNNASGATDCELIDVYKCIDDKGQVDYQAKPCEEGQKNVAINLKTGSTKNIDELAKQRELALKEQQSAEEEQKRTKQQLIDDQLRIKSEAIAESLKNQALIKSDPEKFTPFSIPPFNPEQLPELVKKLPTRIADIERLKRISAEKALATNECNRVESSELDSKSTKALLAFIVNCSSGKAFHYSENDLK